MAYLLKAGSVEAEKQPLLRNDCEREANIPDPFRGNT
jgi:hypothetical protein